MKLFSYVVDHDYGYAPNPFGGFCSLAQCKYGHKKRNIIEMAEVGDWIAGTGGMSAMSAGHGRLIYAMRVDRKTPLAQYCRDYKSIRSDADQEEDHEGRFALLSDHFFYFGRNAIDVAEIPTKHLSHSFEKKGPGYRCDFSEEFAVAFSQWLDTTFKTGVHGQPCKALNKLELPRCPAAVRRKTRCK